MLESFLNINWVPGLTLDAIEKHCIIKAYEFFRGNKTVTANSLGISIRTLDNKLERYENDARIQAERNDAARAEDKRILDRHRGVELTRLNAVGSSHQTSLPSESPGAPKQPAASVSEISPGLREQPTAQAQPKHAMPMPKQQEVQKVLQGQTGSRGHQGRR